MSYAQKTSVPVGQSRTEIERLLVKHGASGFASGWENDTATLMFKMNARGVRLRIKMPSKDLSQSRYEQEERRLWRALLLVVKAKLEAVESGVETFEESWLPHIMVPGGGTVGEEVLPRLQSLYRGGPSMPLLGSGA